MPLQLRWRVARPLLCLRPRETLTLFSSEHLGRTHSQMSCERLLWACSAGREMGLGLYRYDNNHVEKHGRISVLCETCMADSFYSVFTQIRV